MKENPINKELQGMHKKWDAELDENTQLVRFVLPAEDEKMYEVFVRSKCAQKGSTDVSVGFRTAFNDLDSFSAELVKEWIRQTKKHTNQYAEKGKQIRNWNHAYYIEERALKTQGVDSLLSDVMLSFRKYLELDKSLFLNVFLMPQSIFKGQKFNKWLSLVMEQGLPKNCRLVVLDKLGDEYLRHVSLDYPKQTKTLKMSLNYPDISRQVALDGDPSDPEIILRDCLYKMSDAIKQKDVASVNKWGEFALKSALNSGNVPLLGTTYITYAGMLLSLKGNVAEATELLSKGNDAIDAEEKNENISCQHLRLQIYAFRSACCVYDKDKYGAFEWSLKQGHYAHEKAFYMQALTAFRRAAYYAGKLSRKERIHSLELAYQSGEKLNLKEQKFCEFRFVALDWSDELRLSGKLQEAKAIGDNMKLILGKNWESQVREEAELAKNASQAEY